MVAFFFFPELPWIDDWDYWDWGRLCEAASWLATEVSLSSLAQSRSLLERPKVEAATRLQEDLLTSKSQRSYYSFLTFRCEFVIHSKGAYKSGIWHIILIIFHACQPFQIGNFEAAAKCPDLWQSAKAPFEFSSINTLNAKTILAEMAKPCTWTWAGNSKMMVPHGVWKS